MPNYRRAWHPGGTYFFTVNLLERSGNDLLVRRINLLRESVRVVRAAHPFTIHAWVVLPEHLHCVIELPIGDAARVGAINNRTHVQPRSLREFNRTITLH